MSVWTLDHVLELPAEVSDGPALLSGLGDGPGLEAHEDRYGRLLAPDAAELAGLAEAVDLRGRGGAAFPFARKVELTARSSGRPVVVVNVSEGEPASLKDSVLATVAPHLVLDGAALAATALRTRTVHVVLPGHRPAVGQAVRTALRERDGRSWRIVGRPDRSRDGRLEWHLHEGGTSFVGGQSAAVLELLAGRENLPVSTWRPSAESGHRRRPTLLSNAETFAHLARLVLLGARAYRRHGTKKEPGTTLLTLDGDGAQPSVREVPLGSRWSSVLPPERLQGPVLLGGYHGTWAARRGLERLTVSRTGLSARGLALGAGVVLPLDQGCPVDRTARIVDWLASQSAHRCGPCFNGLPALAAAVNGLRDGRTGPEQLERLSDLVTGRGACAHPDGTARLVRSLLTAYDDEVGRHTQGRCGHRAGPRFAARPYEVSA